MVSILPMVDLLRNTAVDWFCILSYFRLDTLLKAHSWTRWETTYRINNIHNFIMIFIQYIYKYTPTYRVTLPSYPTRETKHQIGMALRNAGTHSRMFKRRRNRLYSCKYIRIHFLTCSWKLDFHSRRVLSIL